jgi:DNA-binding transcriptional LysR family regulator
MDIRHVRYFLAVAEQLSFSRAASRLRVAQPALSKQIRNLEDELGGKLFHRTTASVRLTELGEYFRQQAQKLVLQFDIAVTGAQQLAKRQSGTLRVGCDWRTHSMPLASAARRFRETNPQRSIQFVDTPAQDHVSAVRERLIDVGFAPSVFLGTADDLEVRHVYSVRMKVILPRGHRLAHKPRLTLEELKEERWLALDSDSLPGYGILMAQILKFTPKYGLTTTSMPALIGNVTAGNGIGLAPEWALRPGDDGIVIADTECTPIDIFAVSLKRGAPPLLNAYLDALDEAVAARGRSAWLRRERKVGS